MKTLKLLSMGLLVSIVGMIPAFAGYCDPDSLEDITVTGTIQIETAGAHDQYFLEADETIYHLNFGPWWYLPSEGDAARPEEGSIVMIVGGLNTTSPGTYDVIIVYEIDGEFWRNPYDPFWNHFNNLFSSDPETFSDGIACGWPESITSLDTFTGVVLIDTTLVYFHYFLDVNFDGLPDYKLNFGPHWYDPPGSVTLPNEGDTVIIEGAMIHVSTYPIIIVFTIDGEIWREETGFGPGHFGKWMLGGHNKHITILSPFDTLIQVQFQNGWHHGGMPESMYCQVLEIHHQNTYMHQERMAFAGFEIAFFNEGHQNLMHSQQYQHGMLFNKQIRLQFHYTHGQLERAGIREIENIQLFYWDAETESWIENEDIFVDSEQQLVTSLTNELRSSYILTAEKSTSTASSVSFAGDWLSVRPNPVANEAIVNLNKVSGGPVEMALYTVTGDLVKTLDEDSLPAGNHKLHLKTSDVAAGIYYLRVITNSYFKSVPVIIQH